jgi:hypothetical protein
MAASDLRYKLTHDADAILVERRTDPMNPPVMPDYLFGEETSFIGVSRPSIRRPRRGLATAT